MFRFGVELMGEDRTLMFTVVAGAAVVGGERSRTLMVETGELVGKGFVCGSRTGAEKKMLKSLNHMTLLFCVALACQTTWLAIFRNAKN